MRIFDREYRLAKAYLSGTHRSRPPAETVRDYSRFARQMGITRLANVTGLDFIGIPVFQAIRPNSRNLSVSQGKGLDEASAKASALMESIEGWHAETTDLPLKYESYSSLRQRSNVVAIEKLPRVSAAPLQLSAPIRWIEGWDLIKERPIWVPHEMVQLDYVDDAPLTWVQGSNGLASGNHLLEAIEHALSELIERDAVSLWHLDEDNESTKRTQVDISSIDDADCVRVLQKLSSAGIGVGVWDVTAETGIPVYFASIFEMPGLQLSGISNGMGCHLSPAVAVCRALTEAIQSRLTLISGSRDDMEQRSYTTLLPEQDELAAFIRELEQPAPVRQFRGQTQQATSTFEDDIRVLLDSLRKIGVENAVVIDLTKPDIGIPVVKMIVPELEDYVSKALPGSRAQRYLESRAK
jgi:YcaO-like protein with predicted kinase domain